MTVFYRGGNMEKDYFDKLAQTVIDGDVEECINLVHRGMENKVDPVKIIEKGLARGIKKVGDDFGAGIVFLPELIMAADVMQQATVILDKEIKSGGISRKSFGRVVIGTVKGDIHDIGKSVVGAVLQANGFDVVDIGTDVSVEDFLIFRSWVR
jgi:methanogenic corrinoid protein MtbC1